MDRDYYMTAAEAKEYGIIDRVIEHRSLADPLPQTVKSE